MMAALMVVVSFASCGSSGDDQTPTYVEPIYTQHDSPQWNSQTGGDTGTPDPVATYPADLTAYVLLPDSLRAYLSEADEMAAFCGDECRGVAIRPANDEVWMIRIYGNVGDEVKLKYYCATNKYMYNSEEPIVLTDETHKGTYDDPVMVYMRVEE